MEENWREELPEKLQGLGLAYTYKASDVAKRLKQLYQGSEGAYIRQCWNCAFWCRSHKCINPRSGFWRKQTKRDWICEVHSHFNEV